MLVGPRLIGARRSRCLNRLRRDRHLGLLSRRRLARRQLSRFTRAWFDRKNVTASRALKSRCTLGEHLLVDAITGMATATLNLDHHTPRRSLYRSKSKRLIQ